MSDDGTRTTLPSPLRDTKLIIGQHVAHAYGLRRPDDHAGACQECGGDGCKECGGTGEQAA